MRSHLKIAFRYYIDNNSVRCFIEHYDDFIAYVLKEITFFIHTPEIISKPLSDYRITLYSKMKKMCAVFFFIRSTQL